MSKTKISQFETEQTPDEETQRHVSAGELHSFFDHLIKRHGKETIVSKKIGSDFYDSNRIEASFEADDRRMVVQSDDETTDELTISTFDIWKPYEKFHSAGARWLLSQEFALTPNMEITDQSSAVAVLDEAEAIVQRAKQGLIRNIGQRVLGAKKVNT